MELWFAHWEAVPDVSLDGEFERYVGAIEGAEERRDFDFASMRFLAAFRNGHTYFSDVWLRETHGRSLGFDARPIGHAWVITASRRRELEVGGIISAIDGQPMDAFFDDRRSLIGASSARTAAELLFFRGYLFPPAFTLALADGRSIECAGRFDDAPISTPSLELLRHGSVACLRLPSFGDAEFERVALKLIGSLPAGVGLVIDVRGNTGGDTPMLLIETLMDRPFRTWIEATALHELGGSRGIGLQLTGPETLPGHPTAFQGKLAILIDGRTMSAAEDFVAPFKDNGRAVVVGEASGGSSGQPYRQRYENGMSFAVGAKRQYLADGSAFEGVGITPDITIAVRPEDVALGIDRALAAAID